GLAQRITTTSCWERVSQQPPHLVRAGARKLAPTPWTPSRGPRSLGELARPAAQAPLPSALTPAPRRAILHVPPGGEPLMDRWSRRQFVQGVGAVGLTLTGISPHSGCGIAARAPQPKPVPRIGFLWAKANVTPPVEAFREGLHDLGYIEGQTV